MLRKALVSDAVRSFIYCLRTRTILPPAVILGIRGPFDWAGKELDSNALAAFCSLAYRLQPNYILANREVIGMATWLRSFSTEEISYSLYLLEKYYGQSNCTVSPLQHEDQSHFC